MKLKTVFFAVVPATILITTLCYEPAAVLIYKIKEPYFSYPIKASNGHLTIRNDDRGDGDFGAKRRNGRSHSGVDISAPLGTPVYAAKSGIAFRGTVPTGYGKYVMIYHPDGYQTIYGHLSNWNISSVQNVRKGDLIGFSGNTGNAAYKDMQPHLHFEIRKDGEPQAPANLMR